MFKTNRLEQATTQPQIYQCNAGALVDSLALDLRKQLMDSKMIAFLSAVLKFGFDLDFFEYNSNSSIEIACHMLLNKFGNISRILAYALKKDPNDCSSY